MKMGMPVDVLGESLETSARPIQTHNGAGFGAPFATRFVAIRLEGVSRSKSLGACEPTGRAAASRERPHVSPEIRAVIRGGTTQGEGASESLPLSSCSTGAIQQGSRMSSGPFDERRNSIAIRRTRRRTARAEA